MKKRFGITGLAVLIGGSLLILFELIDMINTYSDRTGGPFQFWPLTFFLVSLAWCLLSGLFLFKRKPLLASLVLLLNVLIDNGTVFIIDLFDNALNFNSTAGFGSLILFFALVFLVVALILERKTRKTTICLSSKTPYLILILAAIIFTFIFNNARTGVFLIAMLILLTAFLEEKFIPVVIAIFLMPNFFNLIDGFIRVANRGRLAASTWIMLTLGTIIFIFAIVSYFLPDGVNKGVSKIKEKVSKKEDEIVKTEIIDNEK